MNNQIARYICLIPLCVSLAYTTAGGAETRMLNVDFAGRGGNPKGGQDPVPPTCVGPAAVGTSGDQWNAIPSDSFNEPLRLGPAQNLRDAKGKPTTAFLTIHGFASSDYFPPDQGAPLSNALMNAYLVANDKAVLTIGGLIPKNKYTVYLFGSNSRAGTGAGFSVNGGRIKTTKAANEGPLFSEGTDYVVFNEVETSRHGELEVRISASPNDIAILNGFQLAGELSWATERSNLPTQRRWAAAKFESVADERGQYFDEPCLSFVYDGKSSEELLPRWKCERSSRPLDEQRVERLLTWTDPDTHLQVRCVGIEYSDYPAIEWTCYFKNSGPSDSPLLEKIQAIDTRLVREPEGEFVLHYMPGSLMLKTDYQPLEATLGPGEHKTLATSGGRPCNAFMPYFNLSWAGGGALVAIGWPGQWSASFTREQGTGLQVTAGQELTHFRLHPGEEVRGPLIALLYYQGDWIDGQNLWRRWMVAHNLPRYDGKLLKVSWKACSSHQTAEMIKASEDNQKHFIDRYIEEGLKPDYWWMDAGWYMNDGTWVNTGTWEVDRKRFPNGLRAVSDYAHARGIKTLVWFEPERVTSNSWLYDHHPEWLLSPADLPPNLGYQKVWRLLDLGNTTARAWLTDHTDGILNNERIDLYRQDFNMDPLYFWRANDAPDRQGMREIGHVTGYLAYWDELRRRHPGMPLDSCASGGRRNDLETIRRAIPFLRDDYLFDPSGQQCQTYGLALWLPAQGTAVDDRRSIGSSAIMNAFWLPKNGSRQIESDPYLFRSCMLPHITTCFDVNDPHVDFATLRKLYAQWRSIAENYYGDYYPLTGYSLAEDAWMAWQFNQPESGTGMMQAFRRSESCFEAGRFKLRGLKSDARYTVTDLDEPNAGQVLTGKELMERGLLVTIKEQPGAVVLAYTQAK